jgi:integrase
MVLLGVRGGELRRATWTDVDLDRGLWHPPAERTKVERDFDLPLPPLAIALIQAQRGQHDELVFPRLDGKPEADASKANDLNREMCAAAGISGFVPHDRRHTTATHIEGLGFPPSLLAKIFGHRAEHKKTARYSAYRAEKEMRVALAAWERRVLELAGEATPAEGNARQLAATA